MSASPAPTRPRASRAATVLRIALGLLAGAAAAEAAFHVRDHGAFPHLNVYVPDAQLGVRLRPGATERVAFNGNPRTSVRINAQGYRGADHPSPGANEIWVLGDSQAFGLGVEEHETWSAALSRRFPGRSVLDLGVPTHGPVEYGAILEETLSARGGSGATVIYTVNFANDLFEAERPNRDRHVVWDGWAVRAETAPDQVFSFPGREILYRDSHAVYALRALLHRDAGPSSFASEGTWRDLVSAAAARKDGRRGQLAELVEEEKRAQAKLEAAADKAYPELMKSAEGKAYKRGHGNPRDILARRDERPRAVEASRENRESVSHLLTGADIRRRIERSLRKRAEKEIEKQRARAVLASLAERDEIEKKVAAIEAELRAAGASLSPLSAPLARAAAACEKARARLVVLLLPLDVMVSPSEWAKYGLDPVDMTPAKVLVDDVSAAAAELGLDAVDVTADLAAAEPGAFLRGDIHLTPKGHEAVAEALARAVDRPARSPAERGRRSIVEAERRP